VKRELGSDPLKMALHFFKGLLSFNNLLVGGSNVRRYGSDGPDIIMLSLFYLFSDPHLTTGSGSDQCGNVDPMTKNNAEPT